MANLRRFSKNELLLTNQETIDVFVFFFGDSHGLSSKEITDKDKAFAQALLVEAISASQKIGVTEIIFKLFGIGVPSRFGMVKGVVEFMIKKGASLWFHNSIKNPIIYDMVRRTIAYSYVHSEWGSRWATGEYIDNYLIE